MPELPEVEALADHLRRRAVGLTVGRVDVAALSVLKTFDPPITALYGQTVTGANRWGKYLGLQVGELHLITHLSRAGWLRWSDALSATPLRPGGKSPIALRVHLGKPGDAAGFDLTEAGTQKRLAVWLVDDPLKVPQIVSLGPDALSLGPDELAAVLKGNAGRIKGVITDQKVIAGIGNAYSDEILLVGRFSPYKLTGSFTPEEVARLHTAIGGVLAEAIAAASDKPAKELKDAKRAGMRVHGRAGLPCPGWNGTPCGDTVHEVSFADRSMQYCPTCQTGGKPLADRRMSKLLR